MEASVSDMHGDANGVIIIIIKRRKKSVCTPLDRSSGEVRLQALEIGEKKAPFLYFYVRTNQRLRDMKVIALRLYICSTGNIVR